MFDNILYNKISAPPSTEHFLKRQHIHELLENAVKKPLTVVIAGAGYGKTQSVSNYFELTEKKIMWLQLSELDNLVMRLWERIVYGFKVYSPNLANNLKTLGYPETPAAFDKFLYLVAETTSNLRNFVIVFDDFHLIHNGAVLKFLEKLITSQIQNLSFIIISRTKPNLDLSGMIAKDLVGIITEDDLRFSKDEIRLYYQRQNLYLNEKIISDIYQNTEGWILAAYLVGLSLKRENTNNLNFLTLVKINIFELIEKEIFASASLELQHFLLEFAILDVVPKGLLKELPNYNDSLFSEMTKINLMRYDPSSDYYRIHNLFRDFLLERKGALTSEQIFNIYRITAKWYEKNGYKAEAINYYEKCDDYNKIFDIILSDSRRVAQDVADLYIMLIDKAPKNLIDKQPIMLAVKALYLINNNRIEQAFSELMFLRRKYEESSENAKSKAVLGETYMLLALISIIRQNYEFEELFAKAALCLPKGSALIDYRLNIADGINICGIKNPAAGELKKYHDAMFKAIPIASKVMRGCCSGAEYLNAADSHLMTGNIKEAQENAFKAISFARKKLQHGIECMANFILLRIYFLEGNYTEASAILKKMQEQVNLLETSDYVYQHDIVEGWFFVKISEINKVAEWIKYEEETKKVLPPVTIGREYLVRSDCFLIEGRYTELLAYMELTDKLYAERGILYAIIQNKITKAIIYRYMGNYEGSIKALTEAYELSSPNNLIMQYIEYGSQMKTLIDAAKKNANCKIPDEWLNKVSAESSAYAKNLSNIIKAYKADSSSFTKVKTILTKQEKQILDCLSDGLTRIEISENLKLSVNTVKSIQQNLYSKLGVSNSADAVKIAAKIKPI